MRSTDIPPHHARALYDAGETLRSIAALYRAPSKHVVHALDAFDAAHPTQRRPAVVLHSVDRELGVYPCAFSRDVLTDAAPEANPRTCSVSATTWARWGADGLTSIEADRVATRLGLHPVQVWHDWDDDTLHEAGAA